MIEIPRGDLPPSSGSPLKYQVESLIEVDDNAIIPQRPIIKVIKKPERKEDKISTAYKRLKLPRRARPSRPLVPVKLPPLAPSPGLIPSPRGSEINFPVERERLQWTPVPIVPKLFGFDIFAKPTAKKEPTKIMYSYRKRLQDDHAVNSLNKYCLFRRTKLFAKNNLAENPDAVPKRSRQTAENYMRNVTQRPEESDVRRLPSPDDERTRRKVSVGSYQNTTVTEAKLANLLR